MGEWNFPPQDAVDSDPDTFWQSADAAPTAAAPQWLAFQYHEPLAATGIYVVPAAENGPRECELQATADGKAYTRVCRFTLEKGKAARVDFSARRARDFRLVILSAYGQPVRVSEVALLRQGDEPYLRPGIKWWWFKSGNRSFWDYPTEGAGRPVRRVPPRRRGRLPLPRGRGRYTVHECGRAHQLERAAGPLDHLRFGYTLEGQRKRAESAGSQGGYEADMLDSAALECHFKNTAGPMLEDRAAIGNQVLKYLHIDSYELGADVRGQQPTWSHAFREEFKNRRGYDLLPYLPALPGRIVDSRAATDRFLEDFRWTIGDLMAERFWQRFGELAHQQGVGIHTETGYGTYPYPHIDGLRCAGNNDVPMGEFWFGTDIMSQFNPWGNVIRSVASAAHVYGRPLVQAESFTAWTHWKEYPAALKPVGDQAFVDGLNRMVFHQYTHQPLLDMKPGWQYGAGTHFDRNITWWEQARAFFEYLARCQYLLQQGTFVADALYFYGDGVTKFVPSREYVRPSLPPGYDFDAINTDVLLHRLSVSKGRLVLPGGLSYRVLVLPEDGVISIATLRKVKELVAAGALVVGPKPQRTPGLASYPQSDDDLGKLADEIWGHGSARGIVEKKLGEGRIVWGKSLGKVLLDEGIFPDFQYRGANPGAALDFIHRSLAGTEIYFVTNRQERPEQAECAFRVSGRRPELWDPVTGETRPAEAFRQAGGRTILPLEFAPYGSLFVVFREALARNAQGAAARNFPVYTNLQELTGPWTVSFDPKWGGPAQAEFPELVSWTSRPEQGIRYYSGRATYRKSFDLPGSVRNSRKRVALDLGELKCVAQVRLNGKDLGVLWTKPFRVEITSALQPSGNLLEVDVVNLWPNRIIGDAALPAEKRFTRTNISFKPDDPLLESGLLGPVRLQLIEASRM